MSSFGYPKYGKRQRTGKSGESFVDYFVHQILGWIYRPVHQESDFGIDGYIDIVNNGNVTGQTIGVQIKCGDSYFNKKTDGLIRYEGKNKHLNYYTNSNTPIILVVLNSDCSEGQWVEFNPSITSPCKYGWWIEVPDNNSLEVQAKNKWELIAGPAPDNTEQLEQSWKINNTLDECDFGVYVIPKEDVLSLDYSGIKDIINRLSRNKKALINNRGTLEVLIDGFNTDPREAYEIPEVRNWYCESINVGIPWFYFLGEQAKGMGLTVLLFSCCDIKVKSKESGNTYVEIQDPDQVMEWLNHNFNNLNEFTDEKVIPEEINKEMSERAFSIVRGKLQ